MARGWLDDWSPMDLDDQSRALLARLYTAGLAFGAVALIGALGYRFIGDGAWSFADCLYMAVITLSTVGFSETLPGMDTIPMARAWTLTLILLGSGTLLYFASTLTALIVEGDLRGAIRRRRMSTLLDRLSNHVIVCGVGSTGLHVVEELVQSRATMVVVDTSIERIERIVAEHPEADILYVHGDATEDHVLEEAGIRRARGLIAALHDDRDNLFVTITARALSDTVRLVSKAAESDNIVKLQRAGADAVVSPAVIGAVRMASEMVRPSVLQFLDGMVQNPEKTRRIEEVLITADSPLVGASLHEAGLRSVADALVIAIRFLDGHHEYNPTGDTQLRAGMVLIVLVKAQEVRALKDHVRGAAAS